jgi:O-antigen/teichoic acid export membrane protein
MFCIAVIIVCLNIPACLVLLADNHKKNYLRVFAIGTAVNLTGNILLAHYLQATGTVIAVIITELFITIALYWEVYHIYFSKKENLIST